MSNTYRIGSGALKTPLSTLPPVTAVHPLGSSILVEMLTEQEMTSAVVHIPGGKNSGVAPQGYVVETGPNLDPKSGLKAGQRVLLQGSFVPVPNVGKAARERGVLEVHNIKAILDEEQPAETKGDDTAETVEAPDLLISGPDETDPKDTSYA